MKLQLAPVFTEFAVLQRGKKIPVWGKSADGDSVTVRLGKEEKTVSCVKGNWCAEFAPLEACEKIELSVSSRKTGEKLRLENLAVGEVWLAGGQSNMEFPVRYDAGLKELLETEDDPYLRFFNYPQTPFIGFWEKENNLNDGFWRKWEEAEDRKFFSAVGCYMGLILRKTLKVPVGILGCNWGGTPASAWCALEDIEADEALKPILDWQKEAEEKCDWPAYIKSSEEPTPPQDPKMAELFEKMMMGEDISSFFENGMPDMGERPVYNTYMPGPRAAVRPAGIYNTMLKNIAPYGLAGFIWYQGEDDDAKNWIDFYDRSMIAMITSWRKLWAEKLPFLQVELAPFEGRGFNAAHDYARMRLKQHEAEKSLEDVYDICILDVGEAQNIHPRQKSKVGRRLAHIALKHVYHASDLEADNPRLVNAVRGERTIVLSFSHTAEGLHEEGNIRDVLKVTSEGKDVECEITVSEENVILEGAFSQYGKIRVEYCQFNYCRAVLFNSEDNPVFGFVLEV